MYNVEKRVLSTTTMTTGGRHFRNAILQHPQTKNRNMYISLSRTLEDAYNGSFFAETRPTPALLQRHSTEEV